MSRTNNLDDFLTDVADAIREKKGTNDLINPQDFSSEIASIQSGSKNQWEEIGYDGTPFHISNGIAYAQQLKKQWETSSMTNGIFTNNKNMTICPNIDISKVTSMIDFFRGCSNLKIIPNLNSHNVNSMANYISGCVDLEVILGVDLTNVTTMSSAYGNCNSLRHYTIYNLGKSQKLSLYHFGDLTNWGIEKPDLNARQSLIDSLITYSYDRASNGMSTATIQLSANTKALLTEEEIAQITQKGFTLT